MPKKNPLDDFASDVFTESFNKKVPVLLVSLVFFLLTLYTFLNSGITFGTLFDFGEVATNPLALYTPQLALFLIAFAITLSVTTFFGIGLEQKQAFVPMALFSLIAIITVAFLPSHAPLFLAFALAFGSGAVFASMKKEINFESYSNSTRRALIVLLIAVLLFTIVKIELNKDAYVDQFLAGAASLSPQLAQQVLPLCAQPFSKVDPETVVPRSATALQAQSKYDTYRSSMIQSANSQCNLNREIPAFSSLSESEKTRLQTAEHDTMVLGVRQLLRGLTEQLQSPELKEEMTDFEKNKEQLQELKDDLRSISYFQLVETFFSIFIALILFSILSIFTFVIKVLNYGINFAILKLSKVEFEAKE